MKRIVIATDGSADSAEAVEQGIELASAGSAAVTFVYVRHVLLPFVGEPYYQRTLSAQLGKGRDAVDGAAARAADAGVECEGEVLEGDPATEILRLAHERDADLIVVGSRGLGAFAGTLLGSISSRVVRQADRPVLVVRQRAPRAVVAV
jgi:nucleotide-binding universal stress UspA family protein